MSRQWTVVAPAVAALVALLLCAVIADRAQAAFGIAGFDGNAVDAAGSPYTQAGGHPYAIATSIDLNMRANPNVVPSDGWPDEPVKDLLVDLPPGLIGNPVGLPQCTLAQLAGESDPNNVPRCPAGSQVGRVELRLNLGIPFPLPVSAVFNMVSPPGIPARFGLSAFGTIIVLDGTVRSDGDYGAAVNSRNISEGLSLTGITLTLWGVPADPSHDAQRYCPGVGSPGCQSQASLTPFLRMPTSCTPDGVGLPTTLRGDSWFHPGSFVTAGFTSHLPPGRLSLPPQTDPSLWGPPQGPTNCDRVPFEPSFTATPDQPATTAAPTGFTFDLRLPQGNNPTAVGEGDLKKAVVTLPAGLRISPSSAAGLASCTPEQVALESLRDANCPEASKVGSLRIDTPLLDEPLTGAVYLATPRNNPSGTLLALYLVAKGPGVTVKLAGRVDPDPVTGQLRTIFDNNPQLPFSHLHLEFKGGPRAPLVTPQQCGTYTTHAVLTSWSGKTIASDSSFTLSQDSRGRACHSPGFSPQFSAGTENPVAGRHSSFELSLSRGDEDEELRSLTVAMPQGLLAKIAGVARCPAAEAALGACDEASRIGDVLSGAGAGPSPFYLPGRVYLTDAYNGGAFGLAIVVPAVAGPFDLGTVVVRAAIRLDRHTAVLRVVSDPLPRVLEGIPLQVRDVRVDIDRPRFIINPTSCAPKRVNGSIVSTQGTRALVSSRFQVGECRELALKPRMRFTVGAKGQTRLHSSTPLTATLTQPRGESNLKSVSVTLPLSFAARLGAVNEACTQAQFNAGHCERARTGSAVAITPLLGTPLRGSVYFVEQAGPAGQLPNLVIALRGAVDFDLVGTITIPGGTQLATKFTAVPDVPITSFTLRLFAGRHGAVGVATNLCSTRARRSRVSVVFVGQNGRAARSRSGLHVKGCAATRR